MGPYLSERQWGTVREDYSESGDAWNFFTNDHARSHAYRWGEDGIAGISDDKQRLCFSLALWNGKDPILNDFVVNSRPHAVNPEKQGTKVAAHYQVNIGPGKTAEIRLRLSSSAREQKRQPFGKAFDTLFDERRREADEFYRAITPQSLSTDAAADAPGGGRLTTLAQSLGRPATPKAPGRDRLSEARQARVVRPAAPATAPHRAAPTSIRIMADRIG